MQQTSDGMVIQDAIPNYLCKDCNALWGRSVSRETVVKLNSHRMERKDPDASGWFECCGNRFRWDDPLAELPLGNVS